MSRNMLMSRNMSMFSWTFARSGPFASFTRRFLWLAMFTLRLEKKHQLPRNQVNSFLFIDCSVPKFCFKMSGTKRYTTLGKKVNIVAKPEEAICDAFKIKNRKPIKPWVSTLEHSRFVLNVLIEIETWRNKMAETKKLGKNPEVKNR